MTHVLQNVVFPTRPRSRPAPALRRPRDVVGHRRRARAGVEPGAPRQHPRPHIGADRRRAPRVVRHVLQRVPRLVLAALDRRARRSRSRCAPTGPRTILVYRSNGSGVRQRIETREVERDDDDRASISSSTSTATAAGSGSTSSPTRRTPCSRAPSGPPSRSRSAPGKASIGITTFNKPDYCIWTLTNLADAPDVLELVDRIFLIDQGDRRVDAQPEFPEVAGLAGRDAADHHAAEPRRLRRFRPGDGRDARSPRERLRAAARRRRPPRARVGPPLDRLRPVRVRRPPSSARTCSTCSTARSCTPGRRSSTMSRSCGVRSTRRSCRTTSASSNLRQTPMLHMRLDADYNGWWMCLIPARGHPRGRARRFPPSSSGTTRSSASAPATPGYPTVSVPGVALWHVSWVGKDDSIDWQAYFHARNRIVAGLLHSTRAARRHAAAPQPPGRSEAPDDDAVLPGRAAPPRAARHPVRARAHARESRHGHARGARPRDGFPRDASSTRTPASRCAPAAGARCSSVVRRTNLDNPTGLRLRWFTASTLVSHWFHAPRPENVAQPEVEFGKDDAHWWRLPLYDSALVSAADGSGKNIYTRDRAKFRRMLRRQRAPAPAPAPRVAEALPAATARRSPS